MSKSEFVRTRLVGRVGKTIMRLGILLILIWALPLVTGRFPTPQQQSETTMILLWFIPILFAVEMSIAAIWYGREYEKRWEKGDSIPHGLEDCQDELANNLRRLTTEGLEGSYMIVSVGKPYVQLGGNKYDTHLRFEAISNAYLPSKMQLTEDKISELQTLGFDVSNPKSNYFREVDASGEHAIQVIAKTARDILVKVYGCDPKSRPRIELNIEKS